MRAALTGIVFGALLLGSLPTTPSDTWIASWSTSVQSSAAYPSRSIANLDNQTVRERVRVSAGGARIRLRFSNEFGSTALMVGAATVAVPLDPARVRPDSLRDVTFDGRRGVRIPAGAPVLSDPVDFPVTPGMEIALTAYFPGRFPAHAAVHEIALKRAVISPHGDQTHAALIEDGVLSTFSVAVSAVLVPARPSGRLLVAFGDSITDGVGSTIDLDRTWPSDVARRVARSAPNEQLAVVNAGIAGNRLQADCLFVGAGCSGQSALARLDRDALSLPGVTHLLLSEGLNDVAFPGARLGGTLLADPDDPPTAADLIGAYRQVIERAHTRHVKVIGATLTPFEGVSVDGFYSESKEATRQAVNAWIRTAGAFDAIVDFDAVLRDPDHPRRLLSRFSSRDHLHPNDEGYEALANAIDLRWLK